MANFYTPPKPIIVFFVDGFGIGPNTKNNSVALANTPNLDSLWDKYSSTQITHNVDNDLEQGRIEYNYQNLVNGSTITTISERVGNSIKNETFKDNPILAESVDFIRDTHSDLHVVSKLSDKLDIKVIEEILKKALKEGISGDKVYIHLLLEDFTKFDAFDLIKKLDNITDKIGVGHIASIGGQSSLEHSKLDKYLQLLEGEEYSEFSTWEKGYTNMFKMNQILAPFVIKGKEDNFEPIKEYDSVIILNRDARSFIELINRFGQEGVAKSINLTSLTNASLEDVQNVMFPMEIIQDSLNNAISRNRLKQTKIVREDYLAKFLCPSSNEAHNSIQDENRIVMGIDYIGQSEKYFNDLFLLISQTIDKNQDIIFVHIPLILDAINNSDIDGAIGALELFDKYIMGLWTEIESIGGCMIFTSTMNGAEDFSDQMNSELTQKSNLPFLLVDSKLQKMKLRKGEIVDISPTLLHILGLSKPITMTGSSLYNLK
jgi:2,3-bisphosphoglycerate-independent phosphoglycerate mutase